MNSLIETSTHVETENYPRLRGRMGVCRCCEERCYIPPMMHVCQTCFDQSQAEANEMKASERIHQAFERANAKGELVKFATAVSGLISGNISRREIDSEFGSASPDFTPEQLADLFEAAATEVTK